MKYQPTTQNNKPDLVVRTSGRRWVLPWDCRILSLLVEQQKLRANDLRFNSKRERHEFTRNVFLLSFVDEQLNHKTSPLASLGRELVSLQAG